MKKLLLTFFNMKRAMLCFIFFLSSSLLALKAQYILYGTAYGRYAWNNQFQYGSIFSYNPVTNKQTVLFKFDSTDGAFPIGRMLYASDGMLYGITAGGGAYNMGTVFSFNPKTNTESVVITFDSVNGYFESSGLNELLEAKDGLLYGTTWGGGGYGDGVLFSYDINTHNYSIRCNFNDSTSWGINGGPVMELWQDTGSGLLYGVTSRGGFPGRGGGVVYGFNPANNQLIRYFTGTIGSSNPWSFTGGLTLTKNGLLYGMTGGGGVGDSGTIYSFNISSNMLQMAYQFSGRTNGAIPIGNELLQATDGLLYGTTNEGGDIGGDGVLFSFNPATNIEKVLVNFNDTNGSMPYCRLIQDPDNGLLYGITTYGGDSDYGVLFSYNISTYTYTKLLDFTGPNGLFPDGLTLVDTSKKIDTGIGIVEQKAKSEEVRVFPNPSNGTFTLALSNITARLNESFGQEKCSVEVYNVLGEKVLTSTLPPPFGGGPSEPVIRAGASVSYGSNISYNINLSSQPNGVYFYRVVGENGGLVGDGKVVIER